MSQFYGAYLGAKHGPKIIRKLLASPKLSAHIFLLAASFLALAFWGVIVAGALWVGQPWIVLLFALPVLGTIAVIVAVAARRTGSVTAQQELRQLTNDQWATGWARSSHVLWEPLYYTIAFPLTSFALAGLFLTSNHTTTAIVLAAVGVLSLVYTIPWCKGKAQAGGVWLTPEGVWHTLGTWEQFVPWEHVTRPRVAGPSTVLVDLRNCKTTSTFKIPLPFAALDRPQGDMLIIRTDFLGISEAQLLAVLEDTRRNPGLQGVLGSQSTLGMTLIK